MDDLKCLYCLGKCLYKDHSTGVQALIDILVPSVSVQDRYVEITLIDWKFTAKIIEGEILVGKIVVNRLDRPEDYLIDNYFTTPIYAFSEEEYVAKLVGEIKMFYEAAEFHDGEHPILIKVNVTL